MLAARFSYLASTTNSENYENYAGSENIPYIDRGKGPSIAKALHDPSTTETETREINGDQEDD